MISDGAEVIGLCVVVKNEAQAMHEWIAYHLATGFDRVIVYDNASTDGTDGTVQAYQDLYDVRHVPWPVTRIDYQMKAYDHALQVFGQKLDWMCFLDSDEYLVPLGSADVHEVLSGIPHASAIGINWIMFGSSGHAQKPPGHVLENYLHRSQYAFGPNRHVKTALRPSATIGAVNPHMFRVTGEYVNSAGNVLHWEQEGLVQGPPVYGGARINHYFTRSREHWAEKIRRGQHRVNRKTLEDFEKYDRNEVQDHEALRFLPQTRDIMRQVAARDSSG